MKEIGVAYSASVSSLALADLQREFGWPDGDEYSARRPDAATGHCDAEGEDPADLREAILLALSPVLSPSPHPGPVRLT